MKSDAYIKCMMELALSRLSKQGLDFAQVEQGCDLLVADHTVKYTLGKFSDFSDQLALRLALVSNFYLSQLGTNTPEEEAVSKEWHKLEKEFVLGERAQTRAEENQRITKAAG